MVIPGGYEWFQNSYSWFLSDSDLLGVVSGGRGWFGEIADGSFWMVADGFGWLQVVLGGLGWFSVLVAMVFIYTEEEINHLKLLHLCYILVLLREVAIYI